MVEERSDLGLRKSRSRLAADGKEYVFPSRGDFFQYFKSAGHIPSDAQSLADVPEIAPRIFHDWIRSQQLGCQFASALERSSAEETGVPERRVWLDITVPASRLGERPKDFSLGEMLQPILEAAHEEAVALLFPWVRSLEDFASMLAELCEHPNWFWERRPSPNEDSLWVNVGLRWQRGDGQHSALSWPLGFGDFTELPFTRRCPIAALAMRTRPAPPQMRGIHLAMIDWDEPSTWDVHWTATESKRARLLDDELTDAAKAGVTVRLPSSVVTTTLPPPWDPDAG